ncbi:MAG: phosphodiester glycosidase family protein [Actinomycetota bacterium]|nr:phosphodiester glycosidase family protein [Actinomycetota bacterium]
MLRRTVLLAAMLVLLTAGVAHASGLPLGTPGLAESRVMRTVAPGVTYVDITRGQTTPDEFFTVDVGLTPDRAQADATAADLRARTHPADVLEVQAAGTYYTVRSGHYATQPEAQSAAAEIAAEGFTDVHADYTGDDGTATGGPWRIHVLDIDPRGFRGTVVPQLSNDVVPGRETVTQISARTGALAAINGGYFVIGAADGTPGDLAGLSVLGGDLVSEAVSGRTELLLPRADGSGARIAKLSSELGVRSPDGATRLIDGRNRAAGLIRACGGSGGDQPTEAPLHDITCTDQSELIQYTPRFGATADPSTQVEAALDPRGRVIALRSPGGGPIPPGGSVLGGTGDGADWLRAHARPGRRVAVAAGLREDGHRLPLTASLGVVNGGPRLLDNDRVEIDAEQEGFLHPGDPEFFYRFGVRRNPRTIAGVTGDGHLLLVAADGRAPGFSVGLSFAEEASVLGALGARDAVNLDGGGSTTMTLGSTLVTRPSDATGERPVGDAIVLRTPSRR